MRAGLLRHRITLQDRSAARDALGGVSTDWADFATVWADVSPVSGRERLAADASRTQIDHLITMRYQARFADPVAMAKRRVLYNGRILNITASRDVDERHLEIELSCTEGMNEG